MVKFPLASFSTQLLSATLLQLPDAKDEILIYFSSPKVKL